MKTEEGKDLGGRPLRYETAEQLEEAIENYFNIASPPTISGLALDLGFMSRQSFYDYQERPEFSYIIKRARLRMESQYEAKLQSNNPTGSIFWLKNAGWSDKQEIDQKTEHSGQVGFTGINIIKPDAPITDETIHP